MFRMEIWQDGNCIHEDNGFDSEEEVEVAFKDWVADTIKEYKRNGCEYDYTEDDFSFEMYEENDNDEED